MSLSLMSNVSYHIIFSTVDTNIHNVSHLNKSSQGPELIRMQHVPLFILKFPNGKLLRLMRKYHHHFPFHYHFSFKHSLQHKTNATFYKASWEMRLLLASYSDTCAGAQWAFYLLFLRTLEKLSACKFYASC